MPAYDDLTKEQLDEMSMEERYPGSSLYQEPKSDPFKIVWNTETPTSHTRVDSKDIWINRRDLEARPETTLAHEIAHSRLLKQGIDRDWDKLTAEDSWKVTAWRELEAVLLTIGKDQATDPWVFGYVVLESSREFGNGSVTDGKRVAKTVAKRMGKRGILSKREVKRVLDTITRYKVKLSDYN